MVFLPILFTRIMSGNIPPEGQDDDQSLKGLNPPTDEEVSAYLAGSIDPQRAGELERFAAADPELAAQIQILRMLVDASMKGDMGPIAKVADALGVPLDDFVPDEYEIVAGATFNLLKGAVSEQEAKAYAVYRKEADQLGAHETQCETLDPRALAAVVQAGVYPDVATAEAAVWKVLHELEPVLREMYEAGTKDANEGGETK